MFNIDSNVKHQEILGFGGSFTDSSAMVVAALPQGAQDNFVELVHFIDLKTLNWEVLSKVSIYRIYLYTNLGFYLNYRVDKFTISIVTRFIICFYQCIY